MTAPKTAFQIRPRSFATRFEDVSELGRVEARRPPSGKVRYRIVIQKDGERFRLGTLTIDGVDVAFRGRAHAPAVLEAKRRREE